MLDPAFELAGAANTMVSWLGTYFVHSTVLVGGVWMFSRFLPLDALTRSLLWKMSLVGGLFTATLQTGLGVEPLFGTVSVESGAAAPSGPTLPAPPPPPVAEVTPEPVLHACVGCEPHAAQVVIVHDESVTIVSSSGPGFWDHDVVWAGPALAPPPPPLPPPPPPPLASASEAPSGGSVPWLLAGLFLVGSMVSLGRLGVTVARLRRGLGDRVALHGPLRERLGRLLARACVPQDSVQLSMSERVGSPVALAGREIVVPERALDLPPRQQEAMLAHELAHVLRRDPAWQVLAAVIEAALFFQPLNRVARRGMQEAAEELCDDWAVRNTGSSVHLARCLTEVAAWPGRGDMSETIGSPMAGRRSLLVRRVERLLDDRMRTRGGWARRWRGLLGAALLAMVGLGAPGLSLSLARADSPEAPDLPLAPEPVFAPPASIAPVLAMAPSAPVAVITEATPAEPDARQRRLLRRAQRLERKADRLRRKGGVIAVTPVVVAHPEPPRPQIVVIPRDVEQLKRDAHKQKFTWRGIDEQEIRRLQRAAEAFAAGAAKLDEAQLEALEARVEALGEEIEAQIEARLEGLDLDNLDELGKALEEGLKGLEALPEALKALEELPAPVRREFERELEKLKQGGLPAKAKSLKQLKLDELPEQVRRQVEQALRGRGPHGFVHMPEEARRGLERAMQAQARGAQRAAAQAERHAAQALRPGKPPEVERSRREDAKRMRANAAVQAEVERALRDGTIDADEARRIQDAAQRAAGSN